ncbi:MAG: hypothetical protein WCF24_04095 [Acidimicrobiales bacterium]
MARPGMLGRVATQLETLGYEIPPHAWNERREIAKCMFVSGNSQFDVLAPDDAIESELVVEGRIESIAMPGGRRALEVAELVSIRYADEAFDVTARVPLLCGAVVVKTLAAIDPRTSSQSRHIQDVAVLLTLVEDPIEYLARFSEADMKVMGAIRDRLLDDGDVAWEGIDLDDRLKAQAVVLLTRTS